MVSTTKKISLVVPVYNVSGYLRRCLNSIEIFLAKNCEIIIVNDGSTDSSQIIIDEFVSKCPSAISIYQSNAGLSAARNKGLKYATGEYICFIDSDDYINPLEFSHVIDSLNSCSNSPDVIIYGRIEEYEKWSVRVPDQLPFQEYKSGQEYFKAAINEGTYRTNVWDKLFKREFIESYGISFIEGLLYEDMYFCLMSFMYAKSVIIFPYYPYHYIHYNTTSITKQIRLKDLDVLKFVHLAYDFVSRRDFSINIQSKEFQLLIFNWVSSCLMNKYAYRSLYNQNALKIFKETLANDIFMEAVKYCNSNHVGIRQQFFSMLLLYTPFLYKIILNFSLKIKRIKQRYFFS